MGRRGKKKPRQVVCSESRGDYVCSITWWTRVATQCEELWCSAPPMVGGCSSHPVAAGRVHVQRCRFLGVPSGSPIKKKWAGHPCHAGCETPRQANCDYNCHENLVFAFPSPTRSCQWAGFVRDRLVRQSMPAQTDIQSQPRVPGVAPTSLATWRPATKKVVPTAPIFFPQPVHFGRCHNCNPTTHALALPHPTRSLKGHIDRNCHAKCIGGGWIGVWGGGGGGGGHSQWA